MKLVDKRKIRIIILSIIGGIIFSTYLLYEQLGHIGKYEVTIILLTTLIAIVISVLMIRRANK